MPFIGIIDDQDDMTIGNDDNDDQDDIDLMRMAIKIITLINSVATLWNIFICLCMILCFKQSIWIFSYASSSTLYPCERVSK